MKRRDALCKVCTVKYVMSDRGIAGEYKISLLLGYNATPTREDLKEYVIWAREQVLGSDLSDEERSTLMILDVKVKSPIVSVGGYVYQMVAQELGYKGQEYDPAQFERGSQS